MTYFSSSKFRIKSFILVIYILIVFLSEKFYRSYLFNKSKFWYNYNFNSISNNNTFIIANKYFIYFFICFNSFMLF